jgi:hypothetical protein
MLDACHGGNQNKEFGPPPWPEFDRYKCIGGSLRVLGLGSDKDISTFLDIYKQIFFLLINSVVHETMMPIVERVGEK